MNDDGWTRTNIPALSGIRIHGLSVQAIKAYPSDHRPAETLSTYLISVYWHIIGLFYYLFTVYLTTVFSNSN